MKTISIEFCLVTLFLLFIFIINILHVLYLIIYKHNQQIKSIRFILINSSISSLIVSIWLIPFFYFRTLWSSESYPWRIWSFAYHLTDAVQTYSLLLIVTTRSFQRTFICFTWLTPIVAYSPLLWLSSSIYQLDYAPYRLLTIDIPWWMLTILYFAMYLLPILLALIIVLIQICWPKLVSYSKRFCFDRTSIDEHRKDMTELTDLIQTVLNFQLQSPTDKSKVYQQQENIFLFDDISISPLIHSSSPSKQKTNSFEQMFNPCRLLIIICLLLVVHLPYVLLAVFDLSIVQLSIVVYIHWLGTLFLPMIHLKFM